jgi:PAS domain S-box-containing protein
MGNPPSDPERWFLDQTEVYRQILDAIADMVLVKGAQSRILWANKAFRDYYGMSNQELLNIVDAAFSPVDFTAQYVRDDAQVFETGAVLDIPDEPVARHDGLVQTFHTVKSPLRDAEGKVRMTVGVSRNTTEQKRIKEDLARYREHLEHLVQERTAELTSATEHLRTILAALAEGIVALDAAGRIQLMNPAAEGLIGWSDAEARGRDLDTVLSFQPEAAAVPLEGADLRDLALFRRRTAGYLRNREGALQLVSIHLAPLLGELDAFHGSVLVLRDIGLEREVAEQRLRHQKLESLGLLAGGIAHDFNNILAGILGNVSVARSRLATGGAVDDLLEHAERACVRAQGLTTQLLTFARGGAPVKRVLGLATTVREAAELALSGSAVKLDFAFESGINPVEADESQITQAVNNLVLNAKQAMPRGGKISIRLENAVVRDDDSLPLVPGNYVRITVADSGSGITAENLTKVFDPYFTTRPGGTGLGLASVHSIVQRHGGHVSVSSSPGAGSLFSVLLPAAKAAEVRPEARSAAPSREVPRKLLILDDDGSVRKAMAAMLSIDGHSVVATAGSVEAFEAFEAARSEGSPFDAVFVDLTMPGDLGGMEVIRELRQRDPEVRLFVMSGYSEDPVMANARELGLIGALQKPFGVAVLREVLGRL